MMASAIWRDRSAAPPGECGRNTVVARLCAPIARNVSKYCVRISVRIASSGETPPSLTSRSRDRGPDPLGDRDALGGDAFALQFLALLLGFRRLDGLDLEGFTLLLGRFAQAAGGVDLVHRRAHLLVGLDVGHGRPVDVIAVGVDLGLEA